ncbi:MAG: TIGR02996 domain-containing protein [Deltaproteobacteria bacterium]|nr:TIGR02996 domain-containing protein [Deltaproteobacteria bacterium]
MASLVVFVDADAFRALRDGRPRSPGARWRLGGGDLLHPQLGLLDEDGLLVVVTLEGTAAVAVAAVEDPRVNAHVFAGGDAIELDHDITHLLPRLGFVDATALAEAIARAQMHLVLAPEQVDVLRYELDLDGTAAAATAPRPPRVLVDDDTTRMLRAAVLREPGNDAPRMLYADRLQDLGDPRGELIALQLARGRGGVPKERERELVPLFAHACAGPLATWLLRGFSLERGFVAQGAADDAAIDAEALASAEWATVEAIQTSHAALATSPRLVSARRLATDLDLGALAAAPRPLPYAAITGRRARFVDADPVAAGLPMPREVHRAWRAALDVGALANLRVLGVRARDAHADDVLALLRSSLARGLDRLDLENPTDADVPTFGAAFRELAAAGPALPVLSLRLWRAVGDHPQYPVSEVIVAAARERVVVETSGAVDAAHAGAIADLAAALGAGVPRLELRSRHPQPSLAAAARARFAEVVVDTRAHPSLAL